MQRFYYVAPKESKESILKRGILPPILVRNLISNKELSEEVLGVSYKGIDSSNFQEYVSLVQDDNSAKMVAEAICFSRTGKYFDRDFVALGYSISLDISSLPEFVNEGKSKKMNSDVYPSEVLFKGIILPKYINKHVFAVRAHNFY